MKMHEYVPTGPLSNFVERFFHGDGYAPTGSFERTFPIGTVDLIVNLRDDGFKLRATPDTPPVGLSGAMNVPAEGSNRCSMVRLS